MGQPQPVPSRGGATVQQTAMAQSVAPKDAPAASLPARAAAQQPASGIENSKQRANGTADPHEGVISVSGHGALAASTERHPLHGQRASSKGSAGEDPWQDLSAAPAAGEAAVNNAAEAPALHGQCEHAHAYDSGQQAAKRNRESAAHEAAATAPKRAAHNMNTAEKHTDAQRHDRRPASAEAQPDAVAGSGDKVRAVDGDMEEGEVS